MGRGKKLAELLEPAFLARNAVNPGILDRVAQNLDALEVLDPALAARVRAQEPAAITEAYEAIHQYARPFESRRGLRQLREASPALADDLATADHPQVIRAAEALARQEAFIPPDSLTISEGARMSKAKKAASVLDGVASVNPAAAARAGAPVIDMRKLIRELSDVDLTNPEVLALLPEGLRRGVEAGDPQAIAFATQRILAQPGPASAPRQAAAPRPLAPEPPVDTAPFSMDVLGPPAAIRQRVGVRPSQSLFGSGVMDDAEAARAILMPPAPRDLGVSLADTGLLGPGTQQAFGGPGATRSRQVGTQGGGRVFGDVMGPQSNLRVQVAGPGGRAVDVMPGGGVTGDMPVGLGGDVVGPGAMDVDFAGPRAGDADVMDVTRTSGGLEDVDPELAALALRTERGFRGASPTPPGRVVFSEDAVRADPTAPTPTPELTPAPAPAPAPPAAPAAVAPTVTAPARPRPDHRIGDNAAIAGAAGVAGFSGLHAMGRREFPEMEEPVLTAAPPEEMEDELAGAADLVVEDDITVPEVAFDPMVMDDAALDQIALPPMSDLMADLSEEEEAVGPMVGQPVGVGAPRSDIPAHRRLMEIRELLQRGGSEADLRANPRYADLDGYQMERAVLRGRDLGDRRDRVRMAGILSQGGRLPYGPAALAGDRFLRMDPEGQQEFLADAAAMTTVTGNKAMNEMAKMRMQQRNALALQEMQNQGRLAEGAQLGGFNLEGARIQGNAQLDVAQGNQAVEREELGVRREITNAHLEMEKAKLRQEMTIANNEREAGIATGNAERAAKAERAIAELNQRGRELASAERQSKVRAEAGVEAARVANPTALDPLDALQKAAIGAAGPKLNEIAGKAKSRQEAFALIQRDPIARQAPSAFLKQFLDERFPN
jgi:hypothetical protein